MEKDEARAAECYLQAAEQDYAPAQTNLAVCYFNGIGVDKDVECAHQCWRRRRSRSFPGR